MDECRRFLLKQTIFLHIELLLPTYVNKTHAKQFQGYSFTACGLNKLIQRGRRRPTHSIICCCVRWRGRWTTVTSTISPKTQTSPGRGVGLGPGVLERRPLSALCYKVWCMCCYSLFTLNMFVLFNVLERNWSTWLKMVLLNVLKDVSS